MKQMYVAKTTSIALNSNNSNPYEGIPKMLWQFSDFLYIALIIVSKMFEDYKRLVVDHYRQRLAKGDLPNNLAVPTPGKIKKECLRVFSHLADKNDIGLIQEFFGSDENGTGYGKIIKGTDTDRFRPIVSFLRQTTSDPDDINIELLAWLTNYQPRPFRFDTFQPPISIPGPPPPPPIPPTGPSKPSPELPIPESKAPWHTNRYIRWSGIAFIAAATTLSVSALIGTENKIIAGSQQCMVWSVDHYEGVACSQKIFGKQIISMDTFQMTHFRLITQPDTLTAYSLERVWYAKINNVPECFTAPGKHPVFPDKNLKPLSITILRRYFASK